MKHACPYCGRIHDRRNACGRAPVRASKDSEAREIRNRQVWKRVKRQANERDHFLCVLCLQEGVVNAERLETHHIVSIKEAPELAYDVDNLVTLCRRHHEQVEGIPPGVWLKNDGPPATDADPGEMMDSLNRREGE